MSDVRRRVAVMGATGSIGQQTLDVIRRSPDLFDVVAVSGAHRLPELARVINEFAVSCAVVASPAAASTLRDLVSPEVAILWGDDGLRDACTLADVVVNAVVGFAGLPVTLATLAAGRRLALANKESLIAGASLVETVRTTPGAQLWPVDSEHCAIHQCLAGTAGDRGDVEKLWLTASGGPFRGWSREALSTVTLSQALAHPTWSMGPKITIDSSTLMNKGLEVLEASALFSIEVDRIGVVVHPQSIVHSMVEFVDGAVLAQLSRPDMRLPIAYCLGAPQRLPHHWGQLDFATSWSLDFSPPDREAFPALDLAYEAGRRGGAAPAWLSAANEVAVEAFLSGRLRWTAITDLVDATMQSYDDVVVTDLEMLNDQDAMARRVATGNLPT